MSDPRYPLGAPVNRKPAADLTPIPGRPNWFVDRNGKEIYVEPPRRAQSIFELYGIAPPTV